MMQLLRIVSSRKHRRVSDETTGWRKHMDTWNDGDDADYDPNDYKPCLRCGKRPQQWEELVNEPYVLHVKCPD